MTHEEMEALSDEALLKYAQKCAEEMQARMFERGRSNSNRIEELVGEINRSTEILDERGVKVEPSEGQKKVQREVKARAKQDALVYTVLGVILLTVGIVMQQYMGNKIPFLLMGLGTGGLIFGVLNMLSARG